MLSIVLLTLTCLTSTQAYVNYTWDDWTALDEYVQSDDGYFSWTELGQYEYEGVTLYLINMTSQKWTDETFTSNPIWWHHMAVAIPHEMLHKEHGFLYIGGQDNTNEEFPLPEDHFANLIIAKMANDTGACGAYIFQVPNQPVVFYNDPDLKQRSEDQIIAWTWRTYIDTPDPDPTIILRMPMTKTAKRALDTIYEVAKDKDPSTHIDKFAVTGASKRGWTTWSIACTDQRVVALAPMVFSMLNAPNTIMSHYQNMGGAWSFAFAPYYNEGLTGEFHNPKIEGIYDVEDMYRYRNRVAGIPKLEILSSGDEFFLLDDTLQWWNDMPGPKWMMMLPNAEHIMAPHYVKLYHTLASFWLSILNAIPLPEVSWIMQETEQGGLIVVDTIPKPHNITAWSATTLGNDTRRDFRLAALDEFGEVTNHPVRWNEDVNVVDFGNGYQYGAAAEKVEGEWVGFFIQTIYEGPAPFNYPMYFTTQVNVVPYTRPVGPCLTDEECYSHLV